MKAIVGVFGAAFSLLFSVAVVASGPGGDSPASVTALAEIPDDLLARYVGAAGTCPGLPWQVLAAIGFTESRHAQGRADPVTGDVTPPILGPPLDGTNGTARIADPSSPDGWAHAQGPMQFLPTTWDRWAQLAPGRPAGAMPSPHNVWDAIYTAAAYLCAGRAEMGDIDDAILTYNHSQQYLRDVLAKAVEYGMGPAGGIVVVTGGLACPVAGPVSFRNDWGEPRSGGRTHQGTDISAPYGTALVAAENGVIDAATNIEQGLGGITLWLRGDSGTRYYYAHNASNLAAVGERVGAGQTIAYLGNTGNARATAPHLHFGLRLDSTLTNPYPTLDRICSLRS